MLLDLIPPQLSVFKFRFYRPVVQAVEEFQYWLGFFQRLFIGIGQQRGLLQTFEQLRLKPGVIVSMLGKVFQQAGVDWITLGGLEKTAAALFAITVQIGVDQFAAPAELLYQLPSSSTGV